LFLMALEGFRFQISKPGFSVQVSGGVRRL
jgi:hypothetical protein